MTSVQFQGGVFNFLYLSRIGLCLAWLSPILVFFNLYQEFATLDPFYRVSTPMLCFGFALVISLFSPQLGIAACIFALPLIPNFAFELTAFTGYGRVSPSHNAGFDLMAGVCFGVLLHNLLKSKKINKTFHLPWPASLVMIFLTFSVVLAISRNLHQTQSAFQWSALGYNLLHLRSIGWHDDYRPIFDWIAYGCALTFFATVISVLTEFKNRNHLVFLPLIAGLILSVIVGLFQSQMGIGLQWFHFFFRVDRLGYVALGLQPDIHAFAGYMLIGALGLFGYVYSLENKLFKWPVVLLAIPTAWLGLVLSKSKSTLALALIFLLVMCVIWIMRRSKYLPRAGIAFAVLSVLTALISYLFKSDAIAVLTKFTHTLGLKDLAELNLKLVYRPEIFIAAIRMFLMFPILGWGQSEFYRQSANHQLTQSYFLSIEQNGENAHNYFLQTLVETGTIGFSLFVVLVCYPIYKIKNKRLLLPGIVGLVSIFMGNLYAHSLLVRENLFIATGFLALMYSWLYSEMPLGFVARNQTISVQPFGKTIYNWLAIILLIGVGSLSAREVKKSLHMFPLNFDTQCYKSRPLDNDGWTSGLYEVAMPLGSKAMVFELKGLQPDIQMRSLPAQISIVHGEKDVIVLKDIVLTNQGPAKLRVAMPDGLSTEDSDYRAVLSLSRCFIPRNMGINADGRRLGVQVKLVTPD